MKISCLLKLAPWVLAAIAPAAAAAGPICSVVDDPGSLPAPAWDPRADTVPCPITLHGAMRLGAYSRGQENVTGLNPVTLGEMLVARADAPLLEIIDLLPFMDGMDAAGFFTSDGHASRGSSMDDMGVELLPSLITFFSNPYRFDARCLPEADGPGFRLDNRLEIDLGLMGRLSSDVSIALFSTLAASALTDDLLESRRRTMDSESLIHRFALLLSVSPARDLFLGAAGGAEIVDSPRSYSFELLVEARLLF